MKEENIKGEYQRKVDKSLIPTCNIMGVNIAAINMNWLLKYIDENLSDIKGDYICVSNVHTTVNSYENAAYCAVQNGGLMAIPDGGPLSSVGRKRGYSDMDRTTGPSMMENINKIKPDFVWIGLGAPKQEKWMAEHQGKIDAQYFCEFICNNISNFAIVKCFEIPVVNIFQTWYNVVISINGGR